MSHPVRKQVQATPSCQLLRKSSLLKKVAFSKSTLHAKMKEGGPYHDPDFPRPFYLPKSRVPLWRESEVDAWIAMSVDRYRKAVQNASVDSMSGLVLSPQTASEQVETSPDDQRPPNTPVALADMAVPQDVVVKPDLSSTCVAPRKNALVIPKRRPRIPHQVAKGFSNGVLQESNLTAAGVSPCDYMGHLPAAQPLWTWPSAPVHFGVLGRDYDL